MRPKKLVGQLPKQFKSEKAETLEDLRSAVVDDLREMVRTHDQIMRKWDDFHPLQSVGGNLIVGTAEVSGGATTGFIHMPRFQEVPNGDPANYGGSPFGFYEPTETFYIYKYSSATWVPVGADETETVLWLEILVALENIFESL